ncbi:hypothetical protein N9N67_04220 [Bacteriovoracaceae bacterium]|nr:hypothetical protein [Bacteriovoracaceae bacterium]
MQKLILSLLFLITNVWASEVIPGLIPLKYSLKAAVDLQVGPQQAHQMAIKGHDISLIDIKKNSNVLKDNNLITNHVLIDANEALEFVDILPSRLGILKVSAKKENGEIIHFYLSKKNHNFLLRKNILEKIGYKVPQTQFLSKINLSFNDTVDEEYFKASIDDKLLASSSRWVKEIIKGNKNTYVIEDVVAFSAKSTIYNLTLGIMNKNIHRDRRVLRSVYIPISLVDTSESVNLFSWKGARIVLGHASLNHGAWLKNQYGTSYEDARWILRKILKLSRSDISEIVVRSHYPKAIEHLLIEKIISRRNSLLKVFNLSNEFSELEFDPKISYGQELVNGDIRKEFFPGYASRFSFGNPQSPFSNSELGHYALSRLQSESFAAVIGQLNNLMVIGGEKAYREKLKDIVLDQGLFYPTQAVIVPNIRGNIILSRNIITGNYLGTNHQVQSVDNFGVSFSLGMFVGIEGLEAPLSFKGGANLSLQRVYSHIKPLESIKKAIKEPYKNLIVPLFQQQLAKNQSSNLVESKASLLEMNTMENIKKNLKVGESLIISDFIGPDFNVEIGVSLSQYMILDKNLLKAYAGFQKQSMLVSRYHLYRASKDEIHIYQDDGKVLNLMLSLRIDSYIPVVGISGRWRASKNKMKYYQVDLNEIKQEKSRALTASIIKNNSSILDEYFKPHKIEHSIKDFNSSFYALFFRRNRIKSSQKIIVKHKDDKESYRITRRYDAYTNGLDFENFAIESFNKFFQTILEWDYNIQSIPFINPGLTMGGRAKNRVLVTEFDQDQLVFQYERIFNGFKVKQKKAKKFLRKLNQEAGYKIFDPISIKSSRSILLYILRLKMKIDYAGIVKLTNFKRASFRYMLTKYGQNQYDALRIEEMADRLIKLQNKFIKRFNRKNISAVTLKNFHKFFKVFSKMVTLKGIMLELGEENAFLQGEIQGFRQGDEKGDELILSDTFGNLPIPLHLMPSEKVTQKINILPGELLATWLSEKTI